MKTPFTLLLFVMGIQLCAQPISQPVAARYLPIGAYSKTHVDVFATRSNAASLAQLQQSSAAVYAERRFALSSLNLFDFSAGVVTESGSFALHGNYLGFGLFSQSQFSLAYGRKVSSKVDAGLQFNYHSLRQGNGYGNVSSINASAGVIFHVTDKLNVGVNVYNPIGSKWSKAADEKIPSQFTFGAGYDVSDKLYLSAEIVKEENLPASVNMGLQYRLTEQFFGRAGVSTATSAYFASIGFVMNSLRVDVAASYQSPLGISPGILLLFNIGKKEIGFNSNFIRKSKLNPTHLMIHFKKTVLIIVVLLIAIVTKAQQDTIPVINSTTEQQLENLAEAEESETEDDSYIQQYQQLQRHPLNLNTADETELKAFLFLSALQIQQLVLYRQMLGKLISIYELQSVPGWDLETIRRLLPYVYVGNAVSTIENFRSRFKGGSRTLLLRTSQLLEKQDGFIAKDSTGPKYNGSRQRLVVRYKYQYKNLLQYGITADKDAGEQLFKGGSKTGFDFYSAHLFARNLGIIKFLALGDFTVNMGQGLVSWQSLAFRKSADVTAIKRQADILRPYSSPGEFLFHRGAGITVQKKAWQATAFVSYKKVSANRITDSAAVDDLVSYLQSSGYHRTNSEIADRNQINQLSFGGNVGYHMGRLQVGANAVHHQLSAALQKDAAPYNQYAAGGRSYTNASVDYSYTYNNMHLFGEVATDANNYMAMVHGLLASLDARTDISLLYRRISRAYTSLYTNAFTESTIPINENGLYAGISLRPFYGLTLNAYADIFNFPWLRYRVDRPSNGSEYLAQLTWRPNKQTELYTRYLNQSKAINLSNTGLPVHITNNRPRQTWRTHFALKLTPEISFKSRVELLWYDKQSTQPENGFLTFAEVFYKPLAKPFSGNIRLQYFETDSYDSRLYAFENDVLYSFSIPPSFGKGYRWYLNLNYDVTRKLTLWMRLAQTIMPESKSIGSGYDEITGDHRTEIKLQAALNF